MGLTEVFVGNNEVLMRYCDAYFCLIRLHFVTPGPYMSWFCQLSHSIIYRDCKDRMEIFESCMTAMSMEYAVFMESKTTDVSAAQRLISYYLRFVIMLKQSSTSRWKYLLAEALNRPFDSVFRSDQKIDVRNLPTMIAKMTTMCRELRQNTTEW